WCLAALAAPELGVGARAGGWVRSRRRIAGRCRDESAAAGTLAPARAAATAAADRLSRLPRPDLRAGPPGGAARADRRYGRCTGPCVGFRRSLGSPSLLLHLVLSDG